MSKVYDVIIIGAGPNGLTAGAYLAKSGLKVLVVESRMEIGGGLCSEQVTIPGYLHNTHAVYFAMMDYAPAIADLELETTWGLKTIHPTPNMTLHTSDGKAVSIHTTPEETAKSFAKFSKRDADAYLEISSKFKRYMDEYIGPATYCPPAPTFETLMKLESCEVGREIHSFTERTAKDIVFDYFENEHIRSLMLYAVCMWGLDHDTEGLGFLVPLMMNRASNYRAIVNGSHTLANLLNKALYKYGGEILASQPVQRILMGDDGVKGVELLDGLVIEAKNVLSTVDPHQTFLKMVGESNLDEDLKTRIQDWQWESISLFDVHMALKEAPRFKAAENDPEINKTFINIVGYDTPDQLINTFTSIKKGIQPNTGFNCSFPSVIDPTQAPPGRHTGLISQHACYDLKDGGSDAWYRIRNDHARELMEKLGKYAPNINKDTILDHYVCTPKDIENKLADMVKGSFKQGAYHPLQMGYLRPNEYCSQYRTPIKGLYVGGASSYPGGLVLFGNGYNAAGAIVEDLGANKWWPEPALVTAAKEKGLL